MTAQLRSDPDVRTWDWTKLPQQDIFVWDRSRFAVWQGGRGAKKTSSGFFRIWMTICDPKTGRIRPEWRGAHIIVAAPVLKQVVRGAKERFDEIFDDSGLVIKKINGHAPRRELVDDVIFFFFNVGPNGEGAESWRGSQYAIAMLDEAAQMPEKTFMLANATLRQRQRNGKPYKYQCIITTTPLGENWLWRRLLNPATRKEFRTEDNEPMYPDSKICIIESSTRNAVDAGIEESDYIANMGYSPGSLMYQQEVEGKVIRWAGLVFEKDWKLISDTNPLPKAFTAVYGAVDVGTIDPTAILVIGLDARGGVWVIKEFYKARADFKEWIDKVGTWTREFSVRKWFVDSDLVVRMMRGAGVYCATPYKARDAADVSINYINQKIKDGAFNIAPECYGLISEMRGYEYKAEFDGDEVTFLQKVKSHQSDHAIDSCRYAILPLSAAPAQQRYGAEIGFRIG